MKPNTLHIVTISHSDAWYLVDAPTKDEAFDLVEATRCAGGLPTSSRCVLVTAQGADHILTSLIDKPFLGKLTYVPPPYHIEDTDRVCDAKGRRIADCADEDAAKLILAALLASQP